RRAIADPLGVSRRRRAGGPAAAVGAAAWIESARGRSCVKHGEPHPRFWPHLYHLRRPHSTARPLRIGYPWITVTVFASLCATQIRLVAGSPPTPSGGNPTGTVATTALVAPSITETVLSWPLAT